MIGRTVGHYEVLELLGAGGMGEVYRAVDTQLGREVALKVLPEGFAADRERLARFEREARALAAVDHPRIAAVYSFEAAEVAIGESEAPATLHILVMQLAEGETLDERLAGGPIAFEEARAIALQIAEALEAAHEKGIIHRDLKPANIKIDAEGQVKVLDFGLAKALEQPAPAIDSDQEATLTFGSGSRMATAEMTREGMVLGTVGYMSPEQARGQTTDKRADIWAFGCVLYEMLTGARAFGGETASDRFARILERDPAWEMLSETTPVSIRVLLRRCLAKDPRKRLHDMADVRLELEEVHELEALAPSAPEVLPVWRRALPWVLAAAGLGLGLWALSQPRRADSPGQVTRFSIPRSPLAVRGNPVTTQLAIAPDGSKVAYVSGEGHSGQLYLRHLDRMEDVALAGAEDVQAPFFSPDGEWVAFQQGRYLKRVSVEGGKIWTIYEVGYLAGATWGPDGQVVFGDEQEFGLWTVPWDGGEPRRLTTVDRDAGEYIHHSPQVLPGGNLVLFTAMDDAGLAKKISIVDLKTGEREVLHSHAGSLGRYLASGHLAYGLDGSLMAVPVDLERRSVTGSPVPVLDGLLMGASLASYLAHFAVADNGTLTYVSGPVAAAKSRLVSVSRSGDIQPIGQAVNRVFGPRFSPDGGRIVVTAEVGAPPQHLWVRDLQSGTFSRLTLEGEAWWPIWSPDGLHVAYPKRRSESPVANLSWIVADGTQPAEWLTQSELSEQPTTWTPDGKTLIYHRNDHPDSGWDVMALAVGTDEEPRVLLGSSFNEALAAISPDGRWLAYVSDESGRTEVYVRSYPELDRKRQISTGGGLEPAWSADGRELFYRDGEGRTLTVVPITLEPEFSAGRPQVLVEGRFSPSPLWGRNYDIAPDGRSFVMVEQVVPEDIDAEIRVVVNWFVELADLAPAESD